MGGEETRGGAVLSCFPAPWRLPDPEQSERGGRERSLFSGVPESYGHLAPNKTYIHHLNALFSFYFFTPASQPFLQPSAFLSASPFPSILSSSSSPNPADLHQMGNLAIAALKKKGQTINIVLTKQQRHALPFEDSKIPNWEKIK